MSAPASILCAITLSNFTCTRLRSGTLFASQLYEAQGELERAKSLLRKAFDKDPDFTQAKDELRRLRTRPAEQTKGGFFSRLLKK